MKKLIMNCMAIALVAVASVGLFAQPNDLGPEIDLNTKNFDDWRDHIMPSEDELKFLDIPWERTFKDGILKANELDKPVLLWTMNGHPLGCT